MVAIKVVEPNCPIYGAAKVRENCHLAHISLKISQKSNKMTQNWVNFGFFMLIYFVEFLLVKKINT